MAGPASRATQRITGWLLDEKDRERLLEHFPPLFPDVLAHHVTLDARATPSTRLPQAAKAAIVGIADDGAGVQALVVSLDGTTDRPDGSTYHITWSLDKPRGRRAVESNDVIATFGWRAVDPPIAIRLTPAWLR